MTNLDSFKAYDIRGRIPDEINESLAYDIGRAYAAFVKPKRVAVGYDIRLSSPQLAAALKRGLLESGVDVLDIGLWGTEGSYFATFAENLDGGIMVTASHNPPDYNGMKFVREGARPISADTGLQDMRALIESGRMPPKALRPGSERPLDIRGRYLEHLLSYVEPKKLRPLKVVVNAGNGGAGLIIDQIESRLPFEFIKVNNTPDGTFPNGVPNPMLEENRAATAEVVRREKADVGIAWDGDYDRCFFFDEQGQFIEGYYLVGLLAETFLRQEPGARIVHDPRLTWNTLDIVRRAGGTAVLCKSGHAFIKQKMREVDAAYGGEMSAHHYFRKFSYCDSGMIPWLLVLAVMSERRQSLHGLVGERMRLFPASGEINRKLTAPAASTLARLRAHYEPRAASIDLTDGLSMEFPEWRFNLRGSNTEPLVRLNVESRGNEALMREKTAEVLKLVDG
ncbi:MAG TPA: phosphomannomutase CpsG [Steroidobacteraceae bacterium]|jgi:phosphomannomutase|nr:phosphomannomutase CpsG [Steroidobacteraceae bacterium]